VAKKVDHIQLGVAAGAWGPVASCLCGWRVHAIFFGGGFLENRGSLRENLC